MRVSYLDVRLKRLVHPPKHSTAKSPNTLRALANMTFHIGVTQESMEIIDPNDKMIPTDIIKAISEGVYDQLFASRHISHEA